MPLGPDYIDDTLDGVVGAWPASGGKYRLYSSDPSLEATPSDVELGSDGGYVAADFAPSDWSASSGGLKQTSSSVSFGTSTAAYTDTATYWAVTDSGGALVWSDALTDPIAVAKAGVEVAWTPIITFKDGG